MPIPEPRPSLHNVHTALHTHSGHTQHTTGTALTAARTPITAALGRLLTAHADLVDTITQADDTTLWAVAQASRETTRPELHALADDLDWHLAQRQAVRLANRADDDQVLADLHRSAMAEAEAQLPPPGTCPIPRGHTP